MFLRHSLSILPKPSPLNTQAEQGSQKLNVQATHSITHSGFRYPTEEPWHEALLQLCLYVVHGERKKDLDQKSGLGFKLGVPLHIPQDPVLYIHPTRLGPVFSFNAWNISVFANNVILGLPLLHYLKD